MSCSIEHCAYRYASAAKTITLAILYAPILPLSPMIGFIGIILSYLTDQWLALRVCRMPRNYGPDALQLASTTLTMLPLAQLLLMYLLYFVGWSGTALPFVVGICIWALFKLLPVKALVRAIMLRCDIPEAWPGLNQVDADRGTGNRRCAFNLDTGSPLDCGTS